MAERDRQGAPGASQRAAGAKKQSRQESPVAPGEVTADKGARRKRAQRPPESHVARALRTAYEETIREDVPDEFLDLLGKLT